MPAAVIDLDIEKGADFNYTFGPFYDADGESPTDFSTGYTLALTALRGVDSALPAIYAGTSAGSDLTGNDDGTITLLIRGAITAVFNFMIGSYTLISTKTSGGAIERLSEGNFSLH